MELLHRVVYYIYSDVSDESFASIFSVTELGSRDCHLDDTCYSAPCTNTE